MPLTILCIKLIYQRVRTRLISKINKTAFFEFLYVIDCARKYCQIVLLSSKIATENLYSGKGFCFDFVSILSGIFDRRLL